MNESNNGKITLKTITLKDLWNVLRGCFIFVLIAAVLATGAGYFFAKLNYKPMYSSTAKVFLVGVYEGEFDINQFANDYNVAFRIIDECVIMLNSRTVLNAVGDDLGIANGYANLSGSVSISNPEETRVINITATASSPQKAKQIVDSVCKCGAKVINDMYAYDQFRVFEEGTLNNWPINNIGPTTYAKYGVIAAALVYFIFLAIFLFDNYIYTEEDIETYLGLSVIGDIPDANDSDKRKKKYSNYKGYQSGGKPYTQRYGHSDKR